MTKSVSDTSQPGYVRPDFDGLVAAHFAVINSSAEELVRSLKHSMPAMLAQRRQDRAEFQKRLRQVWGPALDLFEVVAVACQEAGQRYSHNDRPQAASKNDAVFEALTRLHARACKTTEAIRSLLESGHATDALARWRTIHELAVVMTLIRDHDPLLAERYLAHDVIESIRIAELYTKFQARLDLEPLESVRIAQLHARRSQLLKRFSSAFMKAKNGWAAGIIPSQDKSPTFDELERAAHLDHLHPYYKMASHGIHAEPKGIFFQLEVFESRPLLVAGPSNAGLADPSWLTLKSLYICTTQLLTYANDDEFVSIALCAIQHLIDEATEAFHQGHERIVALAEQRGDTNRSVDKPD